MEGKDEQGGKKRYLETIMHKPDPEQDGQRGNGETISDPFNNAAAMHGLFTNRAAHTDSWEI